MWLLDLEKWVTVLSYNVIIVALSTSIILNLNFNALNGNSIRITLTSCVIVFKEIKSNFVKFILSNISILVRILVWRWRLRIFFPLNFRALKFVKWHKPLKNYRQTNWKSRILRIIEMGLSVDFSSILVLYPVLWCVQSPFFFASSSFCFFVFLKLIDLSLSTVVISSHPWNSLWSQSKIVRELNTSKRFLDGI